MEEIELAKQYFRLKEQVNILERQAKKAQGLLLAKLGIATGKLTEKEYQKFEGRELQIGDIAKITLFASSRPSVDWEYLESILHHTQLKRATNENFSSSVRITEIKGE